MFTVTGASRGYAFVEFESERDMQRAYEVIKLKHFFVAAYAKKCLPVFSCAESAPFGY